MQKILSICQAYCVIIKQNDLLDALNKFKSTVSHSEMSQFVECLQTLKNNINFNADVDDVIQNLLGYLQSYKQSKSILSSYRLKLKA